MRIPYDLIIPSASRPHLLRVVLGSLFARVDQFPVRVFIHNDEVFPGKAEEISRVCTDYLPRAVPFTLIHRNPPAKHGPALHWLLQTSQSDYVLYTQDDHKVIRPLPVQRALELLQRFGLNQIRFNKRDTLDKKGREGEEFYKVEYDYDGTTLCAADHWYFQCGVWRADAIRPVVNWWMRPEAPGAFTEHCEYKINDVFNGKYGQLFPSIVPYCQPEAWNHPSVRASVHRTFIWGHVGEPRFVEHIGHLPEDWALERANRDPAQRQI